MAWFTPPFRAGINKLDTGLSNEGGFADSNMIRFYQGRAQVNGGCTLHTTSAFDGKGRASKAWRTLEGKAALAWATASKLYAEIAGSRIDITPNLHETVLTNAFTTVSGSPIVTVTLPFHRLKEGNSVTFSNHQTTVGGLTIEGTYTVTEVQTPGRFTITHGSNASSTVSTAAGGNVDFVAPLPAGLESTPPSGFGADSYGDGLYGGSQTDPETLRDWTLDVWGEFLLANPSGYGLFEFQPETAYVDLAFNGSFTGNANGWALGTGWTYGSNAVTKTAGTGSNLSQDVEGVLEGGRYYIATFTVTRTAGTLKFRVNAGEPAAVIDVGTASAAITKSGTYTRLFLCPADPQDIVFEADSTFAGSVDTVSYKLIDRAYRITTAPPRMDAMFVDSRGLVVAVGTTLIDGTYSSTAYRCSDLANNRSWVPDTDSLATEEILRGIGGRLMCGINTRQQSLVFGDDGVISLQYQGTAGQAFKAQFIADGCGPISRHAVAGHGGFLFWMTNTKKFFIFRGIGATSLGIPEEIKSPIREDVFDNFDYRQALKAHTGINPAFSEAWFFYPDTRDGDECSRVAVCAWTETDPQTGAVPWWSHILARTSWVPSGVFQHPIGFDPRQLIFDQETGYTDNGGALNEYLETAPFDIGDGEFIMRLKRIIPDFKGDTGNIQIYAKTRFSPKGVETTYGPYTATQLTEFLDMRIKARQIALRFVGVSAGAFWRFLALRLDISPTGAKR